jgi:hypothetical protein
VVVFLFPFCPRLRCWPWQLHPFARFTQKSCQHPSTTLCLVAHTYPTCLTHKSCQHIQTLLPRPSRVDHHLAYLILSSLNVLVRVGLQKRLLIVLWVVANYMCNIPNFSLFENNERVCSWPKYDFWAISPIVDQRRRMQRHYMRKTQPRRVHTKNWDVQIEHFCRRISHYRGIWDVRSCASPIRIHLRRALGRACLPLEINPRCAIRTRVDDLIAGSGHCDTNRIHAKVAHLPLQRNLRHTLT